MDPNFEKRLRDLQQAAKAEYEGQSSGAGTTHWFRPQEWTGDVFKLEALHEPFDRKKANEDYQKAVKDPEAPGTTGDVVATTTMIDYLAAMEAAFRVRHTMRRPRAMAHMLGRKRGHGSEKGPLIQCGVEYLRGVLKQSKQQG